MWTELPCQNFHLLLCCAILESEKKQIMDKQYGFNEILKVPNSYAVFCWFWLHNRALFLVATMGLVFGY